VGLGKITEFAKSQGLDDEACSLLSAEYWSQLCERHYGSVSHLLDYRISLSGSDVPELLRKARYFDHIVEETTARLASQPLAVSVSNNRSPIELAIPFSGELTVKMLLDVCKQALGISLDWANFPDLGTSCGPSISMTVDRVAQPFNLKLSELSSEQLARLQLWIKFVWRDGLESKQPNYDATRACKLACRLELCDFGLHLERTPGINHGDRGQTTLDRMNSIVLRSMWQTLA